jgi:hypothetical protein
VTLFASRGIDQSVLDEVDLVWSTRRDELAAGHSVTEPSAVGRFTLLPVFDEQQFVGLLYVRASGDTLGSDGDNEVLDRFGRIAAMALSAPAAASGRNPVELYLERTSMHDVERDQLLRLLDTNEWNIARVARILGITRATVYNRLARHGLARRRIPKTLSRRLSPSNA